MLARGRPSFGTTVSAYTPEDAVQFAINNRRGAKNIKHWGVCSFSNFVEIEIGYGNQIRVM